MGSGEKLPRARAEVIVYTWKEVSLPRTDSTGVCGQNRRRIRGPWAGETVLLGCGLWLTGFRLPGPTSASDLE